MTTAIIPFVGREERAARENLSALVEHAKQHRFFVGVDAIDWTANSWDLKPFYSKSGQNPPGLIAHFTNLETTRRGNRVPDAVDFERPFLEAAKAITTEYLRTTSDTAASKIVATLRTIEKAFRDLGEAPDICNLTPTILDQAETIVRAQYEDSWTYGRLLERVARDFVNQARISKQRISWRTSIEHQGATRSDKVNKDGAASGNVEKLPHLRSIIDLAGVYNKSDYIPDRIVTAWFALAMYAPNRVNEILGLPVNCETEMDGVYGLRWRPLKGGDPMTKFAVTPEWADLARDAVRRLTIMSEKSRSIARWYEENPGQLYLPEAFEHLRDQPVTFWEAAQIIGRTKPIIQGAKIYKALERCGWTSDRSRGEPGTAGSSFLLLSFQSLETFVIGELPRGFPFIDEPRKVLASEALFCLPRGILRGYADTEANIPVFISYSQIKHELGSKPTGETVFSRNGLLDPDTGLPWQLNTHQPRHLLNTLAQSKDLANELIAFWSGRKRVDQNAFYNHMPQRAYIEKWVLLDQHDGGGIKVIGPLSQKVEERARREMISKEDALRLELASTITTRYGLCRHDFALTPCPKDKDCIRCGENTFIKGDPQQIEEAKCQIAIHSRAATAAQEAIDDGEADAAVWLKRHLEKLDRWSLALRMLTDPNLEDGTLITLPPIAKPQSKAGLTLRIRAASAPQSNVTGERPRDFLWGEA